MSARVLLVDDHAMFRQALRGMLEKEAGIEVVGELGDGAQVEEAVARLTPDLVVMDISMPTVNGIEATRHLMARFPQLRIVALSAFGYKQFVMEMMEAGALAYVVKSSAGEQLMQAIQSALKGVPYLCPEATATMVAASRGNRGAQGTAARVNLGRREVEVLRLIAEGKSSPQIGQQLHIAPSTVDVHRRNIMKKLDLHSVVDLTKYAILMGLTRL
ncbi:MAG: response regulator transcription factor [Burkholderiaceae bacterium]|jgi:two-component system NarL family response regulator|nr:response regulator transcription factor [Burkholderiaceae bacterium]